MLVIFNTSIQFRIHVGALHNRHQKGSIAPPPQVTYVGRQAIYKNSMYMRRSTALATSKIL